MEVIYAQRNRVGASRSGAVGHRYRGAFSVSAPGPELASPRDRARVYAAIVRGERVADEDLPLASFIVNRFTRGWWRLVILGLAYPSMGWLVYRRTVVAFHSTHPAWPAATALLWVVVAVGVVAATRRQIRLRRWRRRFMAPPSPPV
jgi:hypothetical protein